MPNSPASTSRPPLPQTPPSPTDLEMEVFQLRREKAQLSQLLWAATQKAAPETHVLEVPTEASDPLWLLAFSPGSEPGTTKILAGTIPPLTEPAKKRLVRLLRGTSRPLEDALLELALPFPAAYTVAQIADRIVWRDGTWQSVTPPALGERLKNALHLPKT